MNDDEIKVGDVVRLKSGGPPMTVVEVLGSSTVRCGYFVDLQYQHTPILPMEAFKKDSDS